MKWNIEKNEHEEANHKCPYENCCCLHRKAINNNRKWVWCKMNHFNVDFPLNNCMPNFLFSILLSSLYLHLTTKTFLWLHVACFPAFIWKCFPISYIKFMFLVHIYTIIININFHYISFVLVLNTELTDFMQMNQLKHIYHLLNIQVFVTLHSIMFYFVIRFFSAVVVHSIYTNLGHL